MPSRLSSIHLDYLHIHAFTARCLLARSTLVTIVAGVALELRKTRGGPIAICQPATHLFKQVCRDPDDPI
jgi:hypothetical protein